MLPFQSSAAEIAALIELGYSAREVAVVYRTNAQSRVLEDALRSFRRSGVDRELDVALRERPSERDYSPWDEDAVPLRLRDMEAPQAPAPT